jgi:hypothetical protein
LSHHAAGHWLVTPRRWQLAEWLSSGDGSTAGSPRCPQAGGQFGCLGAALFGGGQRGKGLPADRVDVFGAVLAGQPVKHVP